MTTALATQTGADLVSVLSNSIYPGAKRESIQMVLDYCEAAGLDPIQKPVHIVPMWDSKAGSMRDVVMPGIGLYRVQAARTGQYAGVSEPEFGPDVTETVGGAELVYPEWCRVTVRRQLESGHIAEFTAKEYWLENYAVRGGKDKSVAPNAMWTKRPRGQLAKCATAQALRSGFPEIGSAPTADEMEGKAIYPVVTVDDGNVCDVDVITKDQAATIADMLEETASNRDAFLRLFKAESVETILSAQYGKAIAALTAKAKSVRSKAE